MQLPKVNISIRATLLAIFLLRGPVDAAESPSTVRSSSETNQVLVNLPTVLRLAGARNLDVQLALEKLAEATARHQSARFQFFPWVTVGIAYRRHDNLIQDTAGDILEVHKQSYAPGGALVSQLDLGDAIYKKLTARQLEHAAGHGLAAQRQDSIVAAAREYFDLSLAQAAVGVSTEALRISTHYEAQVRSAVEAGIAFKGDLLRVSVQAERNRLAMRQAVEQQRVTAARLAQTLHLDPSVELVAHEADLAPLILVETNATMPSLIRQALSRRPELKQGQALVEAARQNKQGTVYGPLIPSLGAMAFGGGLGGGRNGDTGNFGQQEDYFIGLGWRIGPGGLFDFPRQREAKSRLKSARLAMEKLHDDIIRQVVEALTRVQSQSEQINLARRGLTAAQEAFRLAQQRQEFGVGVVLENILTEQDLTRARLDYLKTIAEHDKSQYELSKAIGALNIFP